MDPMLGMDQCQWTPAELEAARSIVARLNNGYYDVGSGNGNGNGNGTRHDRIVNELQAWFPWRNVRQVIDLYVDLVVEMSSQAGGGPAQDGGAGAVVNPSFDLVNDNFGMPPELAAMNVDASMNFGGASMNYGDAGMNYGGTEMNYGDAGMNLGGAGMVFGGVPMEETVEQTPAPVQAQVFNGNYGEEVNQGGGGRQQAAPNNGRFWTTTEHKLFLLGLLECGRGNWKKISSQYVRSRTPVQVSSHAQKFFRRMENTTGKQRYSINDVGLYDAEPSWGAGAAAAAAAVDNNNFAGWQALAFAGGHLEPASGGAGAGHIAPATSSSSVAAMNNVAQFWAPLLYNPQMQQQMVDMQMQQQMVDTQMQNQQNWNDQQMMMGGIAPMEGAADHDNFVPAGADYQQQELGAAYDAPAEQWMMNNNMF
ncbi:uncharacterized protein LOC107304324 [Oryza brachyantha]|uniref:Uncharacterized protein n=1 Tax=Oryza brachyantha TaxID=4533 RepID=J3MBQ6_ORYBR|nr:uncharacterized protein LOC107304324 [Oryza brachyantha]